MTKRERVIAAFTHKESDMIPHQIDITGGEAAAKAYFNTDDLNETLQNHWIGSQCGYWEFPLESNEELTERECILYLQEPGRPETERFVVGEPDMGCFRKPVIDEKKIREQLENTLARKQDKFTWAGGLSVFERGWRLCGFENWLVYMMAEPDFVHAFLDEVCDWNLKILDIICEYPFDGVMFGDDWGQQRGLLVGPDIWREFIKPRVKRMYDRARKSGQYIIQHSCGDITLLLPDLVEMGLTCYQNPQPEIYNMAKLKEEWGDVLAFSGGISTQQLLPYGTPEEVRKVVAETIKIMGKNGGYVAAPAHTVEHDVSCENIAAMLDVFTNQKK